MDHFSDHIERAGNITGRIIGVVRQCASCPVVQVMALALAVGRIAERNGLDINQVLEWISIGWQESRTAKKELN